MGYVVFKGRRKTGLPPSLVPLISFGFGDRVTLNKAAMELLNYTHKVSLLWDSDSERVGLRPASVNDPNGYVVNRPNSYSCGQVHARGFAAFVGLDLIGKSLEAALDGDVLSAVVSDSRTK